MYSFYDYMPYMAHGGNYQGSTNSGPLWYQNGGGYGAPQEQDYPDYESWQEAMDYWLSQLPVTQSNPYQQAAAQQMAAAPYTQASYTVAPPPPPPNFSINPYEGVSVVDFLGAQGKQSGYSFRKKLAQAAGISNYRGTAQQNKKLINSIANNPNLLSEYKSSVSTTSGAIIPPTVVSSDSSSVAPVSVPPVVTPSPIVSSPDSIPTVSIDSSGNVVSTPKPSPNKPTPKKTGPSGGINPSALVLTGTGIGGLGAAYALGKRYLKNTSPQELARLKSMMMPGSSRLNYNRMLEMATKMGLDSKGFKELLKEVQGKSLEDLKTTSEWYKKLPKRQKDILKALDQAEIPNALAFTKPGTAENVVRTNRMLQEAAGEERLAQSLSADRDARAALQAVEEEKAAMRSINAQRAAAARWGKPLPIAPSTIPVQAAEAAEALGLGSRIKEAFKGSELLQQLGKLKGLGKAAKLFSKLRFDDGGQWGGTYIPEYGQFAYGGYHSEIPRLFNQPVDRPNKAMYGMGMAQGGQMPQWLAERRFKAAGNEDMMSQYGYAEGGGVEDYEVGWEGDLSRAEVERLKQMGYKIEVI
jgi:hypothetical protein